MSKNRCFWSHHCLKTSEEVKDDLQNSQNPWTTKSKTSEVRGLEFYWRYRVLLFENALFGHARKHHLLWVFCRCFNRTLIQENQGKVGLSHTLGWNLFTGGSGIWLRHVRHRCVRSHAQTPHTEWTLTQMSPTCRPAQLQVARLGSFQQRTTTTCTKSWSRLRKDLKKTRVFDLIFISGMHFQS